MVLTDVVEVLTCPVCTLPLRFQQGALCCERSHSFDVAKEGYVNLLRKKMPGDTKEMVAARRAFFEQGYYAPVSDLLNSLLKVHLPDSIEGPARILDAGCGEGYYLSRLQQSLADKYEWVQGVGIDISKDAIRLAARRYPASFFLVSNLKETLPLADQALSGMVNIFAPRNVAEYARVLRPGAPLLIIIPGTHHLEELRHSLHLLNIEENKQQHVIEQFTGSFDLLALHALTYKLDLRQSELAQLVMMTPNYWHQSAESLARLSELSTLTTTVDFVCLVLQRKFSVSNFQHLNRNILNVMTTPESSLDFDWPRYWRKQGQSWRREPLITPERQQFLRERLAVEPAIAQGHYPFRDLALTRADVEWLLAIHDHDRGPVDWHVPEQRSRWGLDLRGANLRDADLRQLPLARLRAGLSWSDWLPANDEEREMARAHLDGAQLDGAQLQGAALNGTYLNGASLCEVSLELAELGGANLEGTALKRAFLRETNLIGAHINAACLSGADLTGAYLVGAHLRGADLSHATVSHADFSYVHFEYADLSSLEAGETNFGGAYLQGADLSGAVLTGSDMGGVHLEGANLIRAHLELVTLTGRYPAHLEGADLRGAHLEGANLRHVQLLGADLRGAHLETADLGHAWLAGANLYGAHLEGARFKHTHCGALEIDEDDLARLHNWLPDLPSQLQSAILDKTILDEF